MSRPAGVPQFVLAGIFILAIWALLVATFTAQLVFTVDLSWGAAFSVALRDWLPWALFSPAVAWLTVKFPIERSDLPLSVPVHIAACILVVVGSEFLTRSWAPAEPFSPGRQIRFRGGSPGPEYGPRPPLPERGPERPPMMREGMPPENQRPAFINALAMRARFNIPIYWIIVSIVTATNYYRRLQEREKKASELEARLSQARLQALQMQLQPHFLFNTLNAISTLVHSKPAAADEMIANLSDLLRATLETTRQEVPLQEEISFLDRYLEIQKVRFGERLQVEKELAPDTLNALVPTFILQPIVENAIRHGIEASSGSGKISIRSSVTGREVNLTIIDDGPGLNNQHARKGTTGPSGIGLKNTTERLLAIYGSAAGLSISTPGDKGCTVSIHIPFRAEETRKSAS